MAAMTLAEASGGRFVLGLGVSHPHLAAKLRGHDFARPLTRMREYLAAYRAAVYRGPIAEGWPDPPVLVAALRERMTDLAATDADGALPVPLHAGARGLDARASRCRLGRRPSDPGGHTAGGDRRPQRARGRAGVPAALPANPHLPCLVAAPGIRAGGLGAAGQRPACRRDGGDRDGRRRARPHRAHASTAAPITWRSSPLPRTARRSISRPSRRWREDDPIRIGPPAARSHRAHRRCASSGPAAPAAAGPSATAGSATSAPQPSAPVPSS